jgi:Ca2+-binding EF-hand superfamily protein
MRIASLITVLLSASLGVTVARGEDQQVVVKTPSATFASIDRNGDHRISKTEAGTYKNIIDRFAYIDTDGDGFITQNELIANLTARAVN